MTMRPGAWPAPGDDESHSVVDPGSNISLMNQLAVPRDENGEFDPVLDSEYTVRARMTK